MVQEMYLGSWAGPSLDRRRNSQELPNLCTHSSNVVTGLFPERKGAAEGAVVWDSAVCGENETKKKENIGCSVTAEGMGMGELLSVNCMFGAGFLKEEGCGDFLGLADQLRKCPWFHYFVSAKRRDWIQ